MSTRTVPLMEVAIQRGLVGGPFGSSLGQKDYSISGVPVIRGTNLGFGRALGGDYVYVSEDKVRTDLARNTAESGDLVFTQRGTLGQVALVPDKPFPLYVISQSQMRLRVNPSIASAEYLYYACSSSQFLKQIDDNAISTGVPHINLGILSRLSVPLPELSAQQAIAEVLGALDDKIAANTKLAGAADEWVRACLAALNASAEETMPVSKLVVNRKELAEPSTLDPASKYLGLEHLPRRSIWANSAGTAESVTSTKAKFQSGDILFGKLRPYFHKVISAPYDGVCSTDILVLNPSNQELAGFTLASVASDLVVERATAASEGTRMPRTSWKDLASISVPWPGVTEAKCFSARVSAVRSSVESLIGENQTLAATRDALLPQLMAGKLRVKNAEKVLENAGV